MNYPTDFVQYYNIQTDELVSVPAVQRVQELEAQVLTLSRRIIDLQRELLTLREAQ